MNKPISIDYPLQYERRKTRVVFIGPLKIGGQNPICIQSMTTSSTFDIESCFKEIRELWQTGCQLVRLTIPSRKDLDAIPKIRLKMKEDGITVPLVADIHFSPILAIDACEVFEKVRINPGNFSDKPKNSASKANILSLEEGRAKLRETILPLIKNLKKYKRALRIGVNHGSLSNRMITAFGDSPEGMVESAIEATELFEEEGFDQIIVSLKSSNPCIVEKAYRLLAKRLPQTNSVPFHLGVTEPGEGDFARIKSLSGIGGLLCDGLGDTIRISLSEPSKNEISFANQLLNELHLNSSNIKKNNILSKKINDSNKSLFLSKSLTQYRFLNHKIELHSNLKIGDGSKVKIGFPKEQSTEISPVYDFTYFDKDNSIFLGKNSKPILQLPSLEKYPHFNQANYTGLLLPNKNSIFQIRKFYYQQSSNCFMLPVGIMLRNQTPINLQYETFLSSLLIEGMIDFLLIPKNINTIFWKRILYLLQATRTRITTTDYVACPSCGRTLFDLPTTIANIKEKTNHLKGIKIGIMGCIVNGPGEMADADFGYVGSGPGKIDLYLGQTRMQRNIPEKQAVNKLIELIKQEGLWKEKNNVI